MTLIWLNDLIPLVLVAIGLALVITCTKIAYPLRLAWAFVFRARWLRWSWKLVMCPHCNAWWSGGIVSFLLGCYWHEAFQVAFTACGVMYILQRMLSRNKVAVISETPRDPHLSAEPTLRWLVELQGIGLEPDEDFEELLGLEDEDGNEG